MPLASRRRAGQRSRSYSSRHSITKSGCGFTPIMWSMTLHLRPLPRESTADSTRTLPPPSFSSGCALITVHRLPARDNDQKGPEIVSSYCGSGPRPTRERATEALKLHLRAIDPGRLLAAWTWQVQTRRWKNAPELACGASSLPALRPAIQASRVCTCTGAPPIDCPDNRPRWLALQTLQATLPCSQCYALCQMALVVRNGRSTGTPPPRTKPATHKHFLLWTTAEKLIALWRFRGHSRSSGLAALNENRSHHPQFIAKGADTALEFSERS